MYRTSQKVEETPKESSGLPTPEVPMKVTKDTTSSSARAHMHIGAVRAISHQHLPNIPLDSEYHSNDESSDHRVASARRTKRKRADVSRTKVDPLVNPTQDAVSVVQPETLAQTTVLVDETSPESPKQTLETHMRLEMPDIQTSDGDELQPNATARCVVVPIESQPGQIDNRKLTVGSEMTAERRLSASNQSALLSSLDSRPETGRLSTIMVGRLRHLKQEIERRTRQVNEYVRTAPTPEPDSVSQTDQPAAAEVRRRSLTSLIGAAAPASPISVAPPAAPDDGTQPSGKKLWNRLKLPRFLTRSIDTHATGYLSWCALVTAVFIYNATVIPVRMSFPYEHAGNVHWWLLVDTIADIVYLIDIASVQPRCRYVARGLNVKNHSLCRRHYLRSRAFKYDLLGTLPVDLLLTLVTGTHIPSYRLIRLLKMRVYFAFFDQMDAAVSFPVAIRLTRTISYMVYIIHCNSCIYYFLSEQQAFGQIPYGFYNGTALDYLLCVINDWVYNNEGNAYIRCFYFATKMAIKIGGSTPEPTNVVEYMYMLSSWIVGVLVFALLFGQIRDIYDNATRNRDIFHETMDGVLAYCHSMKVPKTTINRVRSWFLYTWQSQRCLGWVCYLQDEYRTIDKLPSKLQTDLAIAVHYDTLSKVKLFQNCDQALLRDLVLKLKPVLYLPGDFVCLKGEVGKEMYIISKGQLEVVGGEHNEKVFVTLGEGTVFGEISLLAIGGGNRRTANVRSKGFSNLFVLAKDDLHAALEDYPEAKKELRNVAKKMLNKDSDKDAELTVAARKQLDEAVQIHVKEPAPRMADAVIRAMSARPSIVPED